jgi:hypothetical protein
LYRAVTLASNAQARSFTVSNLGAKFCPRRSLRSLCRNLDHDFSLRINSLKRRVTHDRVALERFRFAMSFTRRDQATIRLPIWATVFVALICVAIFGLSGWREWSTRGAELKNAEIEMANLAQSLAQQADDTFELTDNVLTGLVHRLRIDGNGPEAIVRLYQEKSWQGSGLHGR